MCEFCGCGEPPYRSVAVIVPTVKETASGTTVASSASASKDVQEA